MENKNGKIKQEKTKNMIKEHKIELIGLGCVIIGVAFGYKIGFKNGRKMTTDEFSDSLFMNVKKLGTLCYKTEKYPNLVLEARIKESLGNIKGTPINLDFKK